MGTDVEEPNNLTVKDAWELYPDAQSTNAACLADSVMSKYQSDWRERWPLSKMFGNAADKIQSRFEIVQNIWTVLNDDQKKMLPNSVLTTLAKGLPYSAESFRLQADIFSNSSYKTNGFRAWDAERQKTMLLALEKDPLLLDAQKRWHDPSFSIDDRMQLAKRIHAIHAEAYGMAPVDIKTVNKPPIIDQNGKTIIENGSFINSRTIRNGYIQINTGDGTAIHGSFDDFVDTIVHEGTHALQKQIVNRYQDIQDIERKVLNDLGVSSRNGLTAEGLQTYETERQRRMDALLPKGNGWNKELEAGGRLAGIAAMFEYNLSSGYMDNDMAGLANYKANPVESHARDTALAVSGYLQGTAQDRVMLLRMNQGITLYDQGEHDRMKAERAQANNSPATCP